MQKHRILIFPFNLLSHYLRCIVLARRYPDYEILFAYSDKYNQFVHKAGFKTFVVEQFNSAEVLENTVKYSFAWLNEKQCSTIFLSQVEAIKHYQPAFVIGDTSPTLKMAAEYANVKYISLLNAYMTCYYAGTKGLSVTHFMYPFLKLFPSGFTNFITTQAEKVVFSYIHGPFKKIRKHYKLKPVKNYLKEQEGDETFICDAPELFPVKHLPDDVKMIGPLLYADDSDEKELINALASHKSTICICMGSSGSIEKLNFLSEPIYQQFNIVVVGLQSNKSGLLGPHIFHKSFANLDKILPLCKLLICHGGNGTIYLGVKHKVYMLCLTNHFEQEWNVVQLEKLKLGRLIHKHPQQQIDNYLKYISSATTGSANSV